MSTFVCGIVRTDVRDVAYEVDFAFYFERVANELGIGTKMGGNVSRKVHDKYAGEHGKCAVVFELVDSPLDDTAEALFAPNYACANSSNYACGNKSLFSRLVRIQKLFEELLSYPYVVQIEIKLNYAFLDGTEEHILIAAKDFTDKLLCLYQSRTVDAPCVELIVVKEDTRAPLTS